MPKTIKLKISNGQIQAIYSDDLASLLALGQSKIRRASSVESRLIHNGWYADLSPVSGPILGPFPLRQQALDAEIKFLEENVIHVAR